jgi:hypothetical protein
MYVAIECSQAAAICEKLTSIQARGSPVSSGSAISGSPSLLRGCETGGDDTIHTDSPRTEQHDDPYPPAAGDPILGKCDDP